jgi:hypothetical protein
MLEEGDNEVDNEDEKKILMMMIVTITMARWMDEWIHGNSYD